MKKPSLSSIAEVYNGKTPSKAEQRKEGAPVLKIKDVNEAGVFRGTFESFVDPELADKFAHKKLELGDILILNAAHNADYVGSKIYRAQKEVVGALPTGEWLVIRANPEKVNYAYLFHWVRSPRTRFHIRKLVKGIHLYPKDVKDLEIDIPPLPEQKRIAAILDKADAIRRKREKAIELTDSFLRSVFLEMFGDPVLNSKNWQLRKLGELGELNRGKSKHRPRNAPELLGGPYPLIQTGDVANSSGYIREYNSTYSEIGLAQSRLWDEGTLCITIAANIAKTGILTFRACFPDSVVGFHPNEHTTTEFIQSWFSFLQKILEDNAPESAQKNINLEILNNLDVICPPVELQKRFSLVVAKIESMRGKLRAFARQADDLCSSVSNSLLGTRASASFEAMKSSSSLEVAHAL